MGGFLVARTKRLRAVGGNALLEVDYPLSTLRYAFVTMRSSQSLKIYRGTVKARSVVLGRTTRSLSRLDRWQRLKHTRLKKWRSFAKSAGSSGKEYGEGKTKAARASESVAVLYKVRRS